MDVAYQKASTEVAQSGIENRFHMYMCVCVCVCVWLCMDHFTLEPFIHVEIGFYYIRNRIWNVLAETN